VGIILPDLSFHFSSCCEPLALGLERAGVLYFVIRGESLAFWGEGWIFGFVSWIIYIH
jgi:hypothetical protein